MAGEREQRRSNYPRLHTALGVEVESVGGGVAVYRVTRVPASEAGIDGGEVGAVSSFVVTIVADLALVSAVSSAIDSAREVMNGTAEMNLTYLALPCGEVTVRGEVIERGAAMAVVDVVASDQDGSVIARGRGTYAIRAAAR
jgi:acyl-coenzyme A thioesterase PaaI-like protein